MALINYRDVDCKLDDARSATYGLYHEFETKDHIYLVESMEKCQKCLLWSRVYCLEHDRVRFQSVIHLSDHILSYLNHIPQLRWGPCEDVKDRGLVQLYNHCTWCDTPFPELDLYHAGEAFMPTEISHCDVIKIVHMPIEEPQDIIGLPTGDSHNLHWDYSKKLSWEDFVEERLA